MFASSGVLRGFLSGKYLAGSAALTHCLLRGRSGERDFRRMIIVAALGRNDGIASGARLQWDALRASRHRRGTARRRHRRCAIPSFRISHRPGSAYVFHSGWSTDRSPDPQRAAARGRRLPHRLLGLGIA